MRTLAVRVLATWAACAAAGIAQPQAAASAPADGFRVLDQRLILREEAGACKVDHVAGNGEHRTLVLALRAPCHLITWRQPVPRSASSGGESDGRPVGAVGDAMAWRYPSAKGVVVVAVIGDPVPDSMRSGKLYQQRLQQGLTCSASVQGILLHGKTVRLSPKREHVGVLCVESGLDEKDFWLLAHP